MEYKKKYFLGALFTLLLISWLGLSGTAYAWTYNEVKGTIENVITNSGYNNIYLTNLNTWVHNSVAEEWQPIFSSYDNFMIMCNLGAVSDNISNINHAITIYAWNDPNDTYTLYEYKYSSSVWMLKLNTSYDRYTYSGTYDSSWENDTYYNLSSTNLNTTVNLGFANRNNPPIWVIFTNKTILANSTGGVATQNWNTFTQYQPMVWNFTPNGSTVSIANGNMSLYHTIDSIYNCPLGVLKDSIYARKITYSWGTWNGSKYTWGNDRVLYDYNKNGYLPNYFVGSTTEDNYVYSTRIDLNTNNHANDILALTIESDNSTTRGTIITFYLVTDNYTNIVGGVFYPGNTFSGDYNNQYNQQQQTNDIISTTENNTQEIIDTITDDSEVQTGLDNFTNSSGDILNNFGYSPIDNPFYAVIDFVLNSVKDVLLGSGNVTLNVGWHGYNTVLRSQDFTLPDNAVVTLIHLICNGFFIWGLYKYGFKLYQWINSGRLQNLVNEANDHQYYWF